MDIDLLKSAPGDQMDMMMMMHQMEKLPDFSGPCFTDVSEIPMMEFSQCSSNSNTNVGAVQHIIENPHVTTPRATFMNLPSSTISFTGSIPTQEPVTLPFLSNASTAGRWRGGALGGGELSGPSAYHTQSQKRNTMAAMREMIFRIAAMQPIHIDPESVKPPKRRNVKISKDPQSVAARHRRERISERIRILQRLVPGGTKMDTASMLDEAIHYVKFLKNQVQSLERAAANRPNGIGFPVPMSSGSYLPMATKAYQPAQNIQRYSDA